MLKLSWSYDGWDKYINSVGYSKVLIVCCIYKWVVINLELFQLA